MFGQNKGNEDEAAHGELIIGSESLFSSLPSFASAKIFPIRF
jgi:hypothetical protein